jgi:hypothetical protein
LTLLLHQYPIRLIQEVILSVSQDDEDLKISSAELNATGLTREIPFVID